MLGYFLRKQFWGSWKRIGDSEDFPDYSTTISKFQLVVAKSTKKNEGRILYYRYSLFVSTTEGFAVRIFRGRIIGILYWFVRKTSVNERFLKAVEKLGAKTVTA